MEDRKLERQHGQSIILVALVIGVLLLFVALAVDMSSAYTHRRQAQNAADAAALAGATKLGDYFNDKSSTSDADIRLEVVRYAQENKIADTDSDPDNGVNTNVIACYVDNAGDCIDKLPVVESSYIVGDWGSIPPDALGVEVVTFTHAPSFFGSLVSVDGYSLRAVAASRHKAACTAGDCVLPIAVHEDMFQEGLPTFSEGQCYNLYDGGGTGNFGWVNWANQAATLESGETESLSCESLFGLAPGVENCANLEGYEECCTECLVANLDPDFCVRVDEVLRIGDQVFGTVGVINANMVRDWLSYYALSPDPVHLFVYGDGENPAVEGTGCGSLSHPEGLKYNVIGFAAFDITGFRLSSGQGVTCDLIKGDPPYLYCKEDAGGVAPDPGSYVAYPGPYDPDTGIGCVDFPGVCIDPKTNEPCDWETGSVNRITAIARPIFDGESGFCEAIGNIMAPPLTK